MQTGRKLLTTSPTFPGTVWNSSKSTHSREHKRTTSAVAPRAQPRLDVCFAHAGLWLSPSSSNEFFAASRLAASSFVEKRKIKPFIFIVAVQTIS